MSDYSHYADLATRAVQECCERIATAVETACAKSGDHLASIDKSLATLASVVDPHHRRFTTDIPATIAVEITNAGDLSR